MSDTILVSPRHHTHDLHDVYASFMGYFERKGIAWYNHSYSPFFTSFDAFLSFGWGCVVVTDPRTGKGHVAVRAEGSNATSGGSGSSGGGGGGGGAVAGTGKEGGTVQQFARMVKVRFGESLPKLPNQLPITPSESNPRAIRLVTDLNSYKRLAATIPSAELNAKRKRLRAGDVATVGTIWRKRMHNFLALEITWWEKGNGVMLEAGICACRCRNIDAMDSWPPMPDENYRRAHYVVSEWLDKRTNTNHYMPSQPRSYAHGPTQLVSMAALEKIINATISALAEPEADGLNPLVILTIGDSSRLSELKNVHIPSNVSFIDVSNLERSLYRASMVQQASHHDLANSAPLSLRGMLHQLAIPTPPHIPISNSGNAAFYMMLVFQILVDRDCQIPPVLQMPTQPQMPYPTMQIYPPMVDRPMMPASQSYNNRSNSPRRATKAMLPMDELVPQNTGGKRSSVQRPNVQPGGLNGNGQMKRAQTMYWDEAAALNLSPQQQRGPNHSQDVSSGSGSGSGGKDQDREKDKGARGRPDGAKAPEEGMKNAMSRVRLGTDSRSGSDEAIPKSGSRFFLSNIGRKSSGKKP